MRKLYTSIIILAVAIATWADFANPEPVQVPQPDGTMLTIQLHGDEFNSYTTTIDGYTVVQGADKAYRYAIVKDGVLVATDIIAHDATERNATEQAFCQRTERLLHADMTAESIDLKKKQTALIKSANTLPVSKARNATVDPAVTGDEDDDEPLTGLFNRDNFRGLVILVNYNDCKFSKTNSHQLFDDMINKDNYTGYQDEEEGWQTYTGSVRDYFRDASMGTFVPEFDVVGPVEVNRSMYYPEKHANGAALAREVLDAADPYVDFSKYDGDGDGRVDMFFIIYAGYASNQTGNDIRLLWPYASTMTSRSIIHDGKNFNRYACGVEKYGWDMATRHDNVLCGIGTITHEFSHVLGLHDHYDTDGNGTIVPGNWDIMSAGSHNNKGRTPPSYNMYERYVLEMAKPEIINQAGTYTLPELTASNKGYMIRSGVDTEFFMLENRQKVKWDNSQVGTGMLVWRVDSSDVFMWDNNDVNTDPTHPLFELIRATPKWSNTAHTAVTNSAGDSFPGSGYVTSITNATTPSLRSWNGTECPMEITNISLNNKVITLTVGKEQLEENIEKFTGIDAFSKTTISDVQGAFCKWNFTNAGVESTSSFTNVSGHVAALYNGGSIISSPLANGISAITLYAANPGTLPAMINCYVSSDNGASWQKLGTSKSLASKAELKLVYSDLDYPANSLFKFEFASGSSTTPVYADNITIASNINTGMGQPSITTIKNNTDGAYNLAGQRINSGYKGIVIKNGKKIVVNN